MTFTKGQKDALVRKAMAIIEARKKAKRPELMKNWKPKAELKDTLKKIEKFYALRHECARFAEEIGFKKSWNSWEIQLDGNTYTVSYRGDGFTSTFSDFLNEIKQNDVDSAVDSQPYPSNESIVDEVELSALSKDFDMDAFIAKYQNI